MSRIPLSAPFCARVAGPPNGGPSSPSSVIVLHGGALGDFVLTHHVLGRMRDLHPQARIDVVARSAFAKWAVNRGTISSAPDYEHFGIEQLFAQREEAPHAVPGERRPPRSADPRLAERLRGYDLVLNFMGSEASPMGSALRRAGARTICVDPTPTTETVSSRRHITDQWTDAVVEGGLALADHPVTALRVRDEERRLAAARLADALGSVGRPRVIVHPGSGSRAKCCPVEKLERVVTTLGHRGCGVLWMVGPTELDWHGPDWVARLHRLAPVLCEDEVALAASTVMGADVYLGHDAGMTHVAAAAGVGTVALFGPTDPKVWGPLGPCVTTIPCGPVFEQFDVADVSRTLLASRYGGA